MKEIMSHMPPIGMRIIKSAIGVWLCYVVYLLRGEKGIVFYSQLAILWCMQPYVKNSINSAIQRTTGTLIGALYGLIVIIIRQQVLDGLKYGDHLYYLLVSVMIIPILYTTVVIKKKNASYFSTVVFLSIVVVHIGDANPALFTFNRVLDTMIGITLGVIVNMFRIPRKKRKDILFVSGVDDTLLTDKEILTPYSKIELNRMLQEGANFTLSTMRTPGSIVDAINGINWKLPLIVMDGAALYDMNEEKYLSVVELKKPLVKELQEFFEKQDVNCFTNIVIDDVLVISYKNLVNDVEKDIFKKLRKSPYRNYVKSSLEYHGQVLYLMTVGEKEKMNKVYELLKQQDYFKNLKICFYDSTTYPGYCYLKVYDKDATRENMMEELKQRTGLEKTMTFGSIEGRYDMVIDKHDGNKVVKTLERIYEPYFWEKI